VTEENNASQVTDEANKKEESIKDSKKDKFIKEVKSLILIFIVVMGIRSSFYEPFHIPSGSMIPNLFIGDFVLVNKFSYGFKLPFSDYFTPVYLTNFDPPKKGDIIVFRYPEDMAISFIKRVIGVPGDEIEIVNKQVYINGKAIMRDPLAVTDPNIDKDFRGTILKFYNSEIGEKKFVYQETDEQRMVDNLPKFTVPADKFFCMGDNRDFSKDSRYWGFVPKENIRGKAMFVWFSFKNSLLDEVDPNTFKLQLFRIGTKLW
jgi:signal peptidase I